MPSLSPIDQGVRGFIDNRKNGASTRDKVIKKLEIVLKSKHLPASTVDAVISGVDQFAEIIVSQGKSSRKNGRVYAMVLDKDWQLKLKMLIARAQLSL